MSDALLGRTGALAASVAGPAAVDPPLVILTSDAGGNLYFVDSKSGVTLHTGFLLYGSLVAPIQVVGATAFCAENGTQGESVIHAYDLNTGVDLFGQGIQVTGSVGAAPYYRSDGNLYWASSDGTLRGYSVAGQAELPWSPLVLDSAGVGSVVGLMPSPGGLGLVVVTGNGIFGVSLTGTPAIQWTAGSGTAFSGTPLRAGGTLYAASGSTLYAYGLLATPVDGGSVSPLWQQDLGAAIVAGPWMSGLNDLLVGAGSGYQLLQAASGAAAPVTGTALGGLAVANSDFAGDVLAAADGSNNLRLFQLQVSFSAAVLSLRDTVPLGAAAATPPAIGLSAAYVNDVSGTMHAVELSDTSGTALWSQQFDGSGAGGYTAPAPGVNVVRSTAALDFVLDGPAFFPRLRDMLAAAYTGSFAVGSLPPGVPDVQTLLPEVGAAGPDVFVIMWDVSLAVSVAEGFSLALKRLVKQILKVGSLHTNDATRQALAGKPNVQVALEPYTINTLNVSGPYHDLLATQIASQHQKFSVISVAGVKLATVSGFNLITPEYFDEATHPMASTTQQDGLTVRNYHTWHDTGLVLQGPAVALIEAEFDRRWARQKGGPPAASGPTYVKLGYWEIKKDTCLDQNCACDPDPSKRCPPTPYRDPEVSGQTQVQVEVLITNSEYTTPIPKIRDRLIQSIAAATSYVFIENYGFHDPDVLRALVARLASVPSGFVVIVLTPHKTKADDSTQQLGELYLTRPSLAALLLAAGGWNSFTATPPGGQPATYQSSAVSGLEVAINSRGADFSTVTFTSAGNPVAVPLKQVTDIDVTYGPSSRMVACAPVRYLTPQEVNPPGFNQKYELPGWPALFRRVYVHSKLALIDDQVAFVGSANFTRRSLFYDGEIAVRIDDAATVSSIRSALFTHWWSALAPSSVTPATWAATTQSFASNPSSGIGVLPLKLSTMSADLPSSMEWFLFNLVDPSDFL